MQQLNIQNRRYLGGKSKVIGLIEQAMNLVRGETGPITSFADVFAGTGVVGAHFNSASCGVIFNDILPTNSLCHHAWMSLGPWSPQKVAKALDHLNGGQFPQDTWVADNYEGFFHREHAIAIGSIRQEIENLKAGLTLREYNILMASLLYATDRVAQTFGHFEAFRKKKDTEVKPFELIQPYIDDSKNIGNKFYTKDAVELVRLIAPDVVYIDPPYNSRQYGDAYHVLEVLTAWNKPDLFGVARKASAEDRASTKSDFCTTKAPAAFEHLIDGITAPWIAVSYNNMAQKGSGRSNAKISDEEIRDTLAMKGDLIVFEQSHKFYTTGKRQNIDDHKEIVYLVRVTP